MADPQKKRVHVVVGVILNELKEVLIAKRAEHLHQGGLWEFPGGKVEKNEAAKDALRRELYEELGIRVECANPFIKISHDYPDKLVLLDVWLVDKFTGTPLGMQDQPIEWVAVTRLHHYPIPQANKPIVTALRLPREMMITGLWSDVEDFESRLRNGLKSGIKLVQLRAHQYKEQEYNLIFKMAKGICDEFGALLIANIGVDNFLDLSADGLHLTSKQLMQCNNRPVPTSILFGASCHSSEEIKQAAQIEADYISLGPVYYTPTHPDVQFMGMKQFSILSQQFPGLVFALGGMKPELLAEVVDAGGYGIAAISCYWN